MIRPFTCVCMLLAAGSGLYLYQTKHRAQMLDREIGRTIKSNEAVRDRIGVLRGEWALLSEPERLSELSRQHLGLTTLTPAQFAALADLGARLPAPLPPGSFLVPREPEPPPALDAKPMIPIAAVPAKPAPSATQVASMPTPATPPATAPRPAAKPAAASKPAAPSTQIAASQPAAAPPAPTLPAPTPPAPTPPAPTHGRLTAPVVTVAAATIGMPRPPAPGPAQPGNSIGESVARVARGLPPLPYHAEAAPIAATRIATAPIAAPAPLAAPGAPYHPPSAQGSQASAQGLQASALGSALGGPRVALPAPVPYAAAQSPPR